MICNSGKEQYNGPKEEQVCAEFQVNSDYLEVSDSESRQVPHSEDREFEYRQRSRNNAFNHNAISEKDCEKGISLGVDRSLGEANNRLFTL